MPITDSRALAITDWLTNTLNLDIIKFEIASSDASFRRYFRVSHSTGIHIVMDAPPEHENTAPFIQMATLLKSAGLNVPKIYQTNSEQGFILLEDFGSYCFLDKLTADNAGSLYQSAFKALYQLQSSQKLNNESIPCYDHALLSRELDIFYDWFLAKFLDLSVADTIKSKLNKVLIDSALEQPQACVHRDFHSRNLMFLTQDSPGIIDFQDAVIGPITYDLVSLLRDCYISWPESQVTTWIEYNFQHLTQLNLINTDLITYTRWFDLMGLQRHLKAIGIFSRLKLRDNKPHYLADIPRTMKYIKYITNKYPELNEFNNLLLNTILPAYNNNK